MSLIPSVDAQTEFMTHRDFAELTGIRADSIKRTMETMHSKGELAFTQSVEMVDIGSGAKRETLVLRVNERESYILMAKLNPAFVAQLADHWQKTKNAPLPIPGTAPFPAPPDFTDPAASARTYAQAATAFADQFEATQNAARQLSQAQHALSETSHQVLELEQKLEEAGPAMAFFDRYENTSGLSNITAVARKFNIKRKDLIDFMIERKICRREGYNKTLVPYQCHVEADRFRVIPWENHGQRGEQMMFTGKGEIWIEKLWREHQNPTLENVAHLTLIN